jgi:hypothetical protein
MATSIQKWDTWFSDGIPELWILASQWGAENKTKKILDPADKLRTFIELFYQMNLSMWFDEMNNRIPLKLWYIYDHALFSDIYHATFDPASEVDVAMRLVPDTNSSEPVMIERLNQYHRWVCHWCDPLLSVHALNVLQAKTKIRAQCGLPRVRFWSLRVRLGPVWPNGPPPRYMLKYQGVSQKRKVLSVKYKINSVFSQRVSP